MKDLSNLIAEGSKIYSNTYKEINNELAVFIKKYGRQSPKDKNTYILQIDPSATDCIDITPVLVGIDKHLETFAFEKIQSLSVSDTDVIYIDTELNGTFLRSLVISDLIDLYESLYDIDNGEYEEYIEIVDGVIQAKEEDDE